VNGARTRNRLPNWAIGLIAVVLIVFGFYLAFTKRLPFSSRGYQIEAVFRDAQSLAVKSPVRIAGVNVGEVTEVEGLAESNAAVVTMTVKDEGRPIHEDARLQLRPRLFLEGNLFVDVRPGSPSSPELDSGGRIPVQQTSNSVQLDQVLTNVLQADVRGNMQLALREFGNALERYGGADGLRDFNASGGSAFKNTAWVNEAFLGTEAHDLSNLVRNFDIVAASLNRNQPQLKSLVTNLRVVTGSFAAEDEALASAVRELPGTLFAARPVFENLNESFPYLRAFSREALPGVRSTEPTLEVATPFIYQLRRLVSKPELRGLVKDLRPTVPQLAKLARRQVPFMEEARALASCFNSVVIPWSNSSVPANDQEPENDGTIYEKTGYGLAGIAGESRSGDANGQYIRVGLGSGGNVVDIPDPPAGLAENVGTTLFEILGSEPDRDSSAKTPFRPTIPCENQDAPDLRSGPVGPAPPQSRSAGSPSLVSGPGADTALGQASRQFAEIYTNYLRAESLRNAGLLGRSKDLMGDVGKALRIYDRYYGDYWDRVGGGG
jgi:phospholipid/cholesterol/gamma-HCH transport system substrate-binding protein